ncbi:uncharacterized protein LOC109862128 [Pseudomyrmex gracilis]|uniref:uncharacterized protein LOC109862128 n=1 Tax=Pseudomyrmex gracilis TaxID=219809 RepID=UPI0009959112|nr:uncharacterized protein LOC109862128 [Pseudomyrmex gracilis]
MSFYFEANYGLPSEWNSTYYYYDGSYFEKRSLSRQLIYSLFTNKLESLGYPGQDCLLKVICQAAKYALSENGVLDNILKIILFTYKPFTSRSEELPNEITQAEHEQLCDQRYENCSLNPLDLISHYVDY